MEEIATMCQIKNESLYLRTPTAYPTLSPMVEANIEHPIYVRLIMIQYANSNLSHGHLSNFSTKWNVYMKSSSPVMMIPTQYRML
uniref:SFRICE_012567 n=1 Tax=Spodoptera frugiperda TaxID=7108 RepID=A0A2H1WNW4_SPOFR